MIEGHVFQQAEFSLHCRRAIIAFAPGQGELLFMIDVGAQGLLIAVTEPDDAGIFFMLGEAEAVRSEEHTSELQSLMRISYAVFCLKKKKSHTIDTNNIPLRKHL